MSGSIAPKTGSFRIGTVFRQSGSAAGRNLKMTLSTASQSRESKSVIRISLPIGDTVLNALASHYSPMLRLNAVEDAFRKIVTLAYYASISTDEGRQTTPRLILSQDDSTINWFICCRFSPAVPINSASDIAKLSPLIRDHRYALWVSPSKTGDLQCNGLLDCGGNDDVFGSPACLSAIGPGLGGMVQEQVFPDIRIVGPGWLRIQCFMPEFEYRNGELWEKQSFWQIPEANKPFSQFEHWFRKEMAKSMLNSSYKELFTYRDGEVKPGWYSGINRIWSGILREAINRRHGAAFIILPADFSSAQEILQHGIFSQNVSLRKQVLEKYLASAGIPVRNSVQSDVGSWLFKKRQLQSAVDTINSFASLDGCVLFDKDLTPVSFGTKLFATTSLLPLVDYADHRISLENEMKTLGTRNNSACRFCQSLPGALAFVISQDGDLRFYCSTQEYAFAFDHLSP